MARPQIFDYDDLITFSGNFSDRIGEGGFAQVFRGFIPDQNRYGLHSQLIAIKRMRLLTNPDATTYQEQQSMNEKVWLSSLTHPNIIKLIGHSFTGETKCLVLEFAEKGTLTSCIPDLSWRATLDVLCKLGSAIEYIHTSPGGYMHGDIKTDNILMTMENEPKLCDFGSFTREDNEETERVYTPGYVDPQKLSRPELPKDQSDDVYAFTIILLQLIMKVVDPTGGNSIPRKHISVMARDVLRERGTLVDIMLLTTGCSNSDAKKIADLALELTEIPSVVVSRSIKNTFKEAIGSGSTSEDETVAGPSTGEPSTGEPEKKIEDAQGGYIKRPAIGDICRRLQQLKVKETTTLRKKLSKGFCLSQNV